MFPVSAVFSSVRADRSRSHASTVSSPRAASGASATRCPNHTLSWAVNTPAQSPRSRASVTLRPMLDASKRSSVTASTTDSVTQRATTRSRRSTTPLPPLLARNHPWATTATHHTSTAIS